MPTPEPTQTWKAASVDFPASEGPAPLVKPLPARIDGLYASRRPSGRTIQFATRVSPEFDDRVRQIAMRDGLLLVEVLERALDAYERNAIK